ncbi:MAG TPA: sensor domain-containing diguanylate cyclase [Rhodocyclaceae bacterium]|jgi:diguanylate cyclase (GGDEF)-like protein/PAS domain S-box-containing protein|nr:sensor domain-containing diguanylate cyclase [Rhodocyclaceae bacterium]
MSNETDDVAFYKTLLESTRAIPWKIDWGTMSFVYVGPQIKEILGVEPSDWMGPVQAWVDSIHPDERESVVNFCVGQARNGIDHEADYRVINSAGEYVWVRDVVHVLRKPDGSTDALVGFIFNIDERKAAEEKIATMQKRLEEFSFQDGLTRIANRRLFDMELDKEWASAKRTGLPLSLIMLDIDFFKQYNDHYGHTLGDECLKRVSDALRAVATRPRDVLARYGGEEFVMLLPETDTAAARRIGERCREAIFELDIPHRATSVEAATLITVSVGVATMEPDHVEPPIMLVERADRRLYLAKQRGRNCMVDSDV